MNSLSWLLYIADVLPNAATVLGVACTLLLIICTITYLVMSGTIPGESDQEEKDMMISLRTLAGRIAMICICTTIVALFVPSKDTIYLIAASEVGETVVESPRANELMGKINKVIDAQLDRLTPK